MAGHDFMDFRIGTEHTGGSDGCMNMNDPSHAGLTECIESFSLPDAYQNHCTEVSLADYAIIVAEGVMGIAATNYNSAAPYTQGTLL